MRLKTREIGPGVAPRSADSPAFQLTEGRHHELIQFAEPPGEEVLQALAAQGVRVVTAVPDNGFVVSVPDHFSFSGLDLAYASRVVEADKLSLDLVPAAAERLDQPATWLVEFHDDVDPEDARRLVNGREGLQIIEHPNLLPIHLLVRGTGDVLSQLSAWDEVAYLYPASEDLLSGEPVHGCLGSMVGEFRLSPMAANITAGWPATNGSVLLNYTFGALSKQAQAGGAREEIQKALAEWARVAKLQFQAGTNTNGTRNLHFLFATGNHGDPFPFSGNVLAHGFYPAPPNPEPIAGDIHFNDAQPYRVGADYDIFSVALHEIGHALGLNHIDNPNAVMYPYYKRAQSLQPLDIDAIRAIYGAPGGTTPTPAPAPAPAPAPSPATAPQLTLQSPPENSTVLTNAATLRISGTASHSSGIREVRWVNQRGGSGPASGTTTWSASVPLVEGENLVSVVATSTAATSITKNIRVIYTAPSSNPTGAPPSIAVIAPAPNLSTTSTTVAASGIVNAPAGLGAVTWRTSTGQSGAASGTGSWCATIPLVRGANNITFTVTDKLGRSASKTLAVTRR